MSSAVPLATSRLRPTKYSLQGTAFSCTRTSGFCRLNSANDSSYAAATCSSQSRTLTVVTPSAAGASSGPAGEQAARASAATTAATSGRSLMENPLPEPGYRDRADDVTLERQEQDRERQDRDRGRRHDDRPVGVVLGLQCSG